MENARLEEVLEGDRAPEFHAWAYACTTRDQLQQEEAERQQPSKGKKRVAMLSSLHANLVEDYLRADDVDMVLMMLNSPPLAHVKPPLYTASQMNSHNPLMQAYIDAVDGEGDHEG